MRMHVYLWQVTETLCNGGTSDLQSINANAPIYLTFAPNFTEVRADALPKAPSPKDLSEEGNVTDVSFLASVKATLSITVTVEGTENPYWLLYCLSSHQTS